MRPALSPESLRRLELLPDEDESPDTVPCPQFAQKLAAASTVLEEGENLLELLWEEAPSSL